MKKKIRLLSLFLMTVAALTLFAMTANASDDNAMLPSLISEDVIENDNSQSASSDYDIGYEDTAYVSVDMLNLRCGPSTDYNIVKVLKKDQSVTIITKINGWYIVHVDDGGHIGCVSEKYLYFKTPGENNSEQQQNGSAETTLMNLINEVRRNNGLKELTLNSELSRIAQHKANDMVENNYFDHNSEIYGSPFEMIRSYAMHFSSAAENIAGNQSVEAAFYAWMNSEGHARNILNQGFTDTGIGICVSPKYGLVIVQMFIA